MICDGKRCLAVLGMTLLTTFVPMSVRAAELLNVKPVASGSDVVVEVTADIPMTYTFYRIPGEARAVVDIADADPEKVEPLIVVNKGAVASISVDKAQLSGMVVSRLVFNLLKENEVSVTASGDRKTLYVSFGTGGSLPAAPKAAATEPPPGPSTPTGAVAVVAAAPVPPVAPPVIEAPPVAQKPAVEAAGGSAVKVEDPLGLDEPPVDKKSAAQKAAPVEVPQPAAVPVPAAASVPLPVPAPTPVPVPVKLAPVVPDSAPAATKAVIKGIVAGQGYVEIKANTRIASFTPQRLGNPERLVIDLPGAVSAPSVKKAVTVNRNGISQVRFGKYPGHVRVVLDASGDTFPAYEITSSQQGLRIIFKP